MMAWLMQRLLLWHKVFPSFPFLFQGAIVAKECVCVCVCVWYSDEETPDRSIDRSSSKRSETQAFCCVVFAFTLIFMMCSLESKYNSQLVGWK